MDLLIHAIIWLFKALFGEQEPPAQLGPRNRRGDEDSTERGPYNYGDGRGARPAGKAKTLAELLEEARRQTQGAPVESPRPVAPPAPPPRPAAPPAPPRPAYEPAQVFVPSPAIHAPAPAAQTVKRSKKEKRKKAAAQAGAAMPAVVVVPGTAYRAEGARADRTKAALFAAALRGANPKQKREALIKAVVLTEIFSPPRSRRALRRGA